MDKDKAETKMGNTAWLKILLGVSLALNLAVAGFFVGAFLRDGTEGGKGQRGPGLGAFGAPYMMALPREDRRDIRHEMKASHDASVPSRVERRALFDAVLATLRASPFDAAALQDAASQQAEITVLVQQRAQAAWISAVSRMTDAERMAYAAAVEDILNHGPKKRKP